MINTKCMTADMFEVGNEYTKTLSFSRKQVDVYCELTADRNAIHREPEAAQVRFPGVQGIIVPGGLIQSTVSGFFGTEFPGDGAIGLSFVPERFRSPVCPDDKIEIHFVITRIRGAVLEVDITINSDTGERLTSAKAKVLAPDDTYRDWWQAQQ